MALREEAAKRHWLPITIALACLVIAAAVTTWVFYRPLPSRPPGPMYFYDLTSAKVFVAPAALPPIVGPSGDKGEGKGTAVLAYVISCGSCDNEQERSVAYLENRSRELQNATTPGAGSGVGSRAPRFNRNSGGGMEVADAADPKVWVGEATPEGKAIIDRAMSKCGEGKKPLVCLP